MTNTKRTKRTKRTKTNKNGGKNSNSVEGNSSGVERKSSGSYGFDIDNMSNINPTFLKIHKTLSRRPSINKTLSRRPSINKTLSKPLTITSPQTVTKTAINIDYDDLMKTFIDEFQTKIKDIKTLFSNLENKMTPAHTKKFKDTIEEITNLIQDSQGQKDDMEKNYLQNHRHNSTKEPYKYFTKTTDYLEALLQVQKQSCNLKMAITDKINILRDKLKLNNHKFFTRKTHVPLTNAQQIKKIKEAAAKSGRFLTLSDAEKEWATNNVL